MSQETLKLRPAGALAPHTMMCSVLHTTTLLTLSGKHTAISILQIKKLRLGDWIIPSISLFFRPGDAKSSMELGFLGRDTHPGAWHM